MLNKKSDNELINESISGSDFSFRILRDRYALKLKSYVIYSFKYSDEEAEDIINEVFVRLYNKNFKNYHFEYEFSTYIYRAITNEAISIKRSFRKRFLDILDEKHEKIPSVNEINVDNQELVKFLLAKIDQKEREILVLRHFDNFSYEQISEISGVKVTTLRAKHSRTMEKLREILQNLNLFREDF